MVSLKRIYFLMSAIFLEEDVFVEELAGFGDWSVLIGCH
jgi:hypothetical protein